MSAELRFLIAVLATWRVCFLIARQEGPWHVFARFREATGTGLLRRLVGCVKCLSVWVAVPFAFFVGGTRLELVVVWIALSGGASVIDELTKAPFEWEDASQDDLLRTKHGADVGDDRS